MVRKDEIIELEILNWDKHQPKRKDVVNASWFCMYHNIFEHPHLATLHASEFKTWVYLLTLRSKMKQGSTDLTQTSDESSTKIVRVNLRLATTLLQVRTEFIHSSISKLESFQMVRVVTRIRQSNAIEEKSTLEKNREKESRVSRDVAEASPQPRKKPVGKSTPLWEAYKESYISRHKKDPPPRDKSANSMLCKLLERFGQEMSIELIKFYFTVPNAYYVRTFHPIAVLLKDSHTIHGTMTTGKFITNAQSKQMDDMVTIKSQLERVENGELL